MKFANRMMWKILISAAVLTISMANKPSYRLYAVGFDRNNDTVYQNWKAFELNRSIVVLDSSLRQQLQIMEYSLLISGVATSGGAKIVQVHCTSSTLNKEDLHFHLKKFSKTMFVSTSNIQIINRADNSIHRGIDIKWSINIEK